MYFSLFVVCDKACQVQQRGQKNARRNAVQRGRFLVPTFVPVWHWFWEAAQKKWREKRERKQKEETKKIKKRKKHGKNEKMRKKKKEKENNGK